MNRMIDVKIAVYEQQLARWKAAARDAQLSFRAWVREAGDEKLERKRKQ